MAPCVLSMVEKQSLGPNWANVAKSLLGFGVILRAPPAAPAVPAAPAAL